MLESFNQIVKCCVYISIVKIIIIIIYELYTRMMMTICIIIYLQQGFIQDFCGGGGNFSEQRN